MGSEASEEYEEKKAQLLAAMTIAAGHSMTEGDTRAEFVAGLTRAYKAGKRVGDEAEVFEMAASLAHEIEVGREDFVEAALAVWKEVERVKREGVDMNEGESDE